MKMFLWGLLFFNVGMLIATHDQIFAFNAICFAVALTLRSIIEDMKRNG